MASGKTPGSKLVEDVHAALKREPAVFAHVGAITVVLDGNDVVLEGEVGDIREKKIALECAGAVPGVGHLVDRLHVRPAVVAPDGEILSRVRDALQAEREFDDVALTAEHRRRRELVHDAGPFRLGAIEVRVENGVVTLDGEVPSLSHKRLAGALAWWVAGVRDVVNGLGVEPPEEDNDGEIVEALRLVLEADPLVELSRIGVSARDGVVTLNGVARTSQEKAAVEFDAWCLFGVDRVENRIDVVVSTAAHPPASPPDLK
jgi:osmotically-inducible protein OsmY